MGMTAMVAGSVAGSVISSYQQYRAGQIEKKVSDQQAGILEGDASRAIESLDSSTSGSASKALFVFASRMAASRSAIIFPNA